MPTASRTVTINGVLELPCCPDTGSDHTIISQFHWSRLLDVDSSVLQLPLDSPVDILTYGAHSVVAKTKAKLHVLIHTAAGPVQSAEAVPCLVAETEDDEFIIGRDLLGALGIDVDRQLEQLAVHGEDKTSGDPFDLEADEPPVLPDRVVTDAEVRAAVEVLVDRALEHGFPPDKEGTEPCKCKPRKYPPHIRQFLRDFNKQLVDLGWVYENPTSRWASPVLPVKKSQELMGLRQTTDYREVNSKTEFMAAVMPILSLVMANARGKQHFGLFDFIKGFWQLPLAEFCQEWLSYMTDEKIFTPRRVPQGCADAVIHFQKTMEKCFATLLYKHLLVWIDDLLLYADDIDTYLDKLAEFFELLNEFGLKLSVKKFSLYQKEVKWCGKIIDANGVGHDPARIDSLRAMPHPTLTKTRRTKRAAAGISIELDVVEKAAFDKVKEMLASAATLSVPDDTATTCLLTDASDMGWVVITTQVRNFDIKTPVQDQQHSLLECPSGTFTGSQLNWTVIEKEAFPIAHACDKLDYLLLRPQGFRMFCDHRNLIHVFAPDASVNKPVRGKLLRWSMKLMKFNYIIELIAGPHNVWADMVSRWAGNHILSVTAIKRLRADAAHQETVVRTVPPSTPPLRPLHEENFIWPTLVELSSTQALYEPPAGAVPSTDGVLRIHNRVWIPEKANALIQRLYLIAHCGSQGHRGGAAMTEHLRRLFAIKHLHSLVSTFVRLCRLCLHSNGGETIPRPWGETIEYSKRNDVLYFDYLSMGESFGDSKYLLVPKDHASYYCEL
ncbi:unnamed protein product [Phytophthora fragariaefolia]|uniref:RNA-directed DNA polymerase n=1 Tax=Phytophthora fragariaefolia TaxID=1490495 RepID=A0A9W6YBT5_9STRA|nr:unnamed protein product [Phytophthora fragariaefolia]